MILTKEVMYRGKCTDVNKLSKNSHIKVSVKCPCCKEVRETPYRRINANGHFLCQTCALRSYNKKEIKAGEVFGKWEAIAPSDKKGYTTCVCECGTVRDVENTTLRIGTSKSCGCISIESRYHKRELMKVGAQYGRLTIIGHSKVAGHSHCKCSCGNSTTVKNTNLESGRTKSCGCLRADKASVRAIKRNKNYKMKRHPNWKGGITGERHSAMSKKEYKDWRTAVFERDEYSCQKCGQVGRELRAHHIYNFANYPERRLDTTNGITLCDRCHRQFHHINGFETNREQLNKFLNEGK